MAVLGAGSWGTALATLLAGNGVRTTLWTWEEDHAGDMARDRCNTRFLPGRAFPDALHVTADMAECVRGQSNVLLVVPSHAFGEVLERVRPHLHEQVRLAWGTKGFEHGTGRLLHQVAETVLGPGVPLAALSGPTFADEVAAGLPAAVTVASGDADFAVDLSRLFHNGRFRVYTSDDLVGVQAGGAVKNVLAIAAGIADGLGFGANTRAALITRGLAELMRLGIAMGGRGETFMGLAGLGDLVLTCTDNQSRNRRFALALAGGADVAAAEAGVGQVVEGVRTAREVQRLAGQLNVDMPITAQVNRVLYEGVPPADAVNALLARAAGPEVR